MFNARSSCTAAPAALSKNRLCQMAVRSTHSWKIAGRAWQRQTRANAAARTPGTVGDSGLNLEVIIHLWSSATQHVRFHFSGLSVWDVQFGHGAGCFTCPAQGSFFMLHAPQIARADQKIAPYNLDWRNRSLNPHLVVVNWPSHTRGFLSWHVCAICGIFGGLSSFQTMIRTTPVEIHTPFKCTHQVKHNILHLLLCTEGCCSFWRQMWGVRGAQWG